MRIETLNDKIILRADFSNMTEKENAFLEKCFWFALWIGNEQDGYLTFYGRLHSGSEAFHRRLSYALELAERYGVSYTVEIAEAKRILFLHARKLLDEHVTDYYKDKIIKQIKQREI